MAHANTGATGPVREPHPAHLGLVDGLDIHARYQFDRTGGDFFDAVRLGTRVAFLLSDIAGLREQTDPIAAATQDAFRIRAAQLFSAGDANLMEGTEMLVQAINAAIVKAAGGGICFAPTMLGCYDAQIGVLAYINAGGQTAMLHDSDGTRPLPNSALPLGLTTHMPYEASMQAFEPGAKLLVVTKGVTLSMRGKTPFGPDRVRESLHGAKDQPAENICRAVLQAAAEFHKDPWLKRKAPLEDMTALAMARSAK